MAEVILARGSIFAVGDRIEYQDHQKLQAVIDKDLSGIFKDNVVIGHSPAGRIVFHGLHGSALDLLRLAMAKTDGIEEGTQHGENDLFVRAGDHMRQGLDALYRQDICHPSALPLDWERYDLLDGMYMDLLTMTMINFKISQRLRSKSLLVGSDV